MKNRYTPMTPEEFDISELLPQRYPFIMVDRLTYYDPVITKTIFRVNDDNLFCRNGVMEESGLIEIIAQTCAARMGYKEKTETHRDGRIKIGVIGMIKKMEIFRNPYAGEELETTIEIVADVFNSTLVETKIESGNETLATCEMKIYLTEKVPG
ncbi:MAG: pseudouridylate synthase [Tannerella sp.]|jgi:3-hydroxymyristoyl/3-hydroxydecanoyl-(acyl carrier protein) dehydratase|nr:pseudouridylate synthase [Tannerella sp.]